MKSLVVPLLGLVFLNLLPQFYLRPVWIAVLGLVLLGYRYWIEFSRRPLPPRIAVWAVQAGACAAIWMHYHTFFGDEAGGALLTLLACLKTFELNRKRDYFLTALLCILVLMSDLLIDQGLLITGFLVVDVIAITSFMLALETEKWSWSSWKRYLRPSVGMTLKSLPLMILMFVLFPRFNTGFGHSGETTGKTGVTDSLRPGSVAQLIQSDELVFRATFLDGNMPNRNQLYWRGAVLDRSKGLNWDRSKSSEGGKYLPTNGVPSPDLEIYLEPGEERFLFSLEGTRYLDFPAGSSNHVAMREGKTYELSEPLQTRERYLIERSLAPVEERADADQYLDVEVKPSKSVQKFMAPYEGKSAGETVNLLRDYFSKNFKYSLKPPRSDTLDDFLFKNKIGFCEHFAGATATLLRYLHIPSRVVVGFQGGTSSLFNNYISVRGHDAHAWVEYYDAVDKRWRHFDPTAAVEPMRVSEGSDSYFEEGRSLMPSWMPARWLRAYVRTRAFMDEVEANWTGFLLHFDLARQKELLAKLGVENRMFRTLAIFLLGTAALILMALYFFEAQKREPQSRDEKLYSNLLIVLRKWKIQRAPAEGPKALLQKVYSLYPQRADEVNTILSRFVLVRYGGKPLDDRTAADLAQRIRLLRRFK